MFKTLLKQTTGPLTRDLIANTEGFDNFSEFVKNCPPAAVALRTGLTPEAIESLALTVSEPGKRVSWWWTMGINQSYEGVRAAQAMINLALITGRPSRADGRRVSICFTNRARHQQPVAHTHPHREIRHPE